jgi:hypothetical protein
MNEKRTKAFNEWWLIHAQPENRMTPSAIWDAACDWMKEEILWEFEHHTEKVRNDREG